MLQQKKFKILRKVISISLFPFPLLRKSINGVGLLEVRPQGLRHEEPKTRCEWLWIPLGFQIRNFTRGRKGIEGIWFFLMRTTDGFHLLGRIDFPIEETNISNHSNGLNLEVVKNMLPRNITMLKRQRFYRLLQVNICWGMKNVFVMKIYKGKQYKRWGKWEKKRKLLGSGGERKNKL